MKMNFKTKKEQLFFESAGFASIICVCRLLVSNIRMLRVGVVRGSPILVRKNPSTAIPKPSAKRKAENALERSDDRHLLQRPPSNNNAGEVRVTTASSASPHFFAGTEAQIIPPAEIEKMTPPAYQQLKKSKCLKLYCDCFSAERYCV